MKGLLSLITFHNVVVFVLVIALAVYALRFYQSSKFDFTASAQQLFQLSFSNFGTIGIGSGIAGNLGTKTFCQTAYTQCVQGDSSHNIPSCADRNRCDYLDVDAERACNQSCLRECSKNLNNCLAH